MEKILDQIDRLNGWMGKILSWLLLFMVAVTFFVVILRYLFNVGWVWMQDSVQFAHAVVFLGLAGFGLLRQSHVRVDVFYRIASPRFRAWVDLFGSLFLLIPSVAVIFYHTAPYVLASWSVWEGSREPGGLGGIFLLKSFILVAMVFLLLQGVSLAGRSILVLRDSRG